jgi:hypothetical protein
MFQAFLFLESFFFNKSLHEGNQYTKMLITKSILLLKITYQDTEIKRIVIPEIAFWNTGKELIRRSDIAKEYFVRKSFRNKCRRNRAKFRATC